MTHRPKTLLEAVHLGINQFHHNRSFRITPELSLAEEVHTSIRDFLSHTCGVTMLHDNTVIINSTSKIRSEISGELR